MSLKRSDYGSTDEIVDELQDLYKRCDTSSLRDATIEDFKFQILLSTRIFDWFKADSTFCHKEAISETISRIEQQLADKEFDTYDDEESWQ